MAKKEEKKTTNEKPVKIPLSFKDALKGLLNTKPPQEEKQEGKEKPADS